MFEAFNTVAVGEHERCSLISGVHTVCVPCFGMLAEDFSFRDWLQPWGHVNTNMQALAGVCIKKLERFKIPN